MHPGSPALPEGKPAAGEREHRFMVTGDDDVRAEGGQGPRSTSNIDD